MAKLKKPEFTPGFLNLVRDRLTRIGGPLAAVAYEHLSLFLVKHGILGSSDLSLTLEVSEEVVDIITFCNKNWPQPV